MWCWGNNNFGQFGDGTTQSSIVPVKSNNSNWKNIAIHDHKTCGIKVDNTLWCWGLSPSTRNQADLATPPTQLGLDNDWDKLVLGSEFMCATKVNMDLYCWGDNSNGKIGNGKAWRSQWAKIDFSDSEIILH